MIAEFMRSPQSTLFAQMALLMFIALFIAILWRVCLMPRQSVKRMASMALDDESALPRSSTQSTQPPQRMNGVPR